MTQIPVAGPDRPCGLRERKKARTRAAIRRHALRLFREQGYQRTTVEQGTGTIKSGVVAAGERARERAVWKA